MKQHIKLLSPILVFIGLIFLGSVAYQQVEGWSYVDSVYFTTITATTIGYGDLVPKTNLGKVFTIIFSFLGIAMAFYLFSLFGRYIFTKRFEEKVSLRKTK